MDTARAFQLSLLATSFLLSACGHAARWIYDPATQSHSKAMEFCGTQTAERF